MALDGTFKVAAILKYTDYDNGHKHTCWDVAVKNIDKVYNSFEWLSRIAPNMNLDTYISTKAWVKECFGISLPQAQYLEKQGIDSNGIVYYTTHEDDIYYNGLRGRGKKQYWIGEKEGLDYLYGRDMPADAVIKYKRG